MLKLHEALEKAFPASYIRQETYVSTAENGFIEHNDGKISFKLQEGAINEVGLNGVQVDEVLHFTRTYLEVLNTSYPCDENVETIKAINNAIVWQKKRTKDRQVRGVEGYSKG